MSGSQGNYPTVALNEDGDEVFIVTAYVSHYKLPTPKKNSDSITSYRWGEYLGYIDVTFDPEGKILTYNGAPIHLTNTTAQDPDLQAQITAWRGPFEEFAAEVVGESKVVLEQTTCQKEECTLGDFMADAMLDYRIGSNPSVAGAIINAGGIRATIDEGKITRGGVLNSFPFGNAIVELTFTGKKLWDAFEGIVGGTSVFNNQAVTSFVQISKGLNITYNPQNNKGKRLISLSVGNAPVDLDQEYTIVTLDFLAGGGDNFWYVPYHFAPQSFMWKLIHL